MEGQDEEDQTQEQSEKVILQGMRHDFIGDERA
jgi:hypothetical protein